VSRRARWVLAGAVLLSLLVVSARLALPAVPGWFIYSDGSDRSVQCDVIVVAGSDPQGSSEAEGARLWSAGAGRCLLCVGRPAAWNVSAEAVMARHLRVLGIPPDRILTFHIPFSDAPDAGTMREEDRLLLPCLLHRGVRSAMVIATALESRRRFLRLGSWRRAGLRVRVHAIPEPQFHPADWWRRKPDTKLVVGEILGWLTLPFGG
jgi:hypothetical protein